MHIFLFSEVLLFDRFALAAPPEKTVALDSDSSSSVDIVQPKKRPRQDEAGREPKRQMTDAHARPANANVHGAHFGHPRVGRYQLIVDFVIPVDEV